MCVIGIVAFAATAFLVQSPTTDRTASNAAIDRFELQRGTAVGSGILVALSTLFPQEDFPINQFNSGGFGTAMAASASAATISAQPLSAGAALGDRPARPAQERHVPVEPGSYKNAVIILLTDGQTNAGYDPVEAARIASRIWRARSIPWASAPPAAILWALAASRCAPSWTKTR